MPLKSNQNAEENFLIDKSEKDYISIKKKDSDIEAELKLYIFDYDVLSEFQELQLECSNVGVGEKLNENSSFWDRIRNFLD